MTPRIIYGSTSVQIVDSYKITSESEMLDYIGVIKTRHQCPDAVRQRGTISLLREWQAHNLLYVLCIQRLRTGSVDFDEEPRWRRAAYHVLAVFYLPRYCR